MTPLFNGFAIFGPACIVNHQFEPNAVQENHYPGVNGIERLDLGVAATHSTIHGTLCGETPDDVATAVATIRTLKNNATLGLFTDTEGTTWTDAVIESFATSGRLTYAPGWGWCRDFDIRIIHLG